MGGWLEAAQAGSTCSKGRAGHVASGIVTNPGAENEKL